MSSHIGWLILAEPPGKMVAAGLPTALIGSGFYFIIPNCNFNQEKIKTLFYGKIVSISVTNFSLPTQTGDIYLIGNRFSTNATHMATPCGINASLKS